MEMSSKDDAKMNGLLDKKISRRTLLKGFAGITAVAIAGAAFTVEAQAKANKAAVKYQDTPKGDQKCSDCNYFFPSKTSSANGTCQLVEGSISPQGWCTLYAKKS